VGVREVLDQIADRPQPEPLRGLGRLALERQRLGQPAGARQGAEPGVESVGRAQLVGGCEAGGYAL
jgi:hypothetical protein